MKFSEFCQNFYAKGNALSGLKGITSQARVVEFFLSAALGEEAAKRLQYSDDSYRGWFTGKNGRGPTPSLWNAVIESFDKQSFSKTIAERLDDNTLLKTANNFELRLTSDEPVDKCAFADALADQFYAIARGYGEAENIVAESYCPQDAFQQASQQTCQQDYSEYLKKSKNRFGSMKTLLYSDAERPFYDFYVCNSVSYDFSFHLLRQSTTIENPTPASLEKINSEHKSSGSIVIGPSGFGKSMLMRHFFLTAANQYEETGILPILVFLRNYDGEKSNLIKLIADSVLRFDRNITDEEKIILLLQNGKCLLLMDGMDEIKPEHINEFYIQLCQLLDGYPQNKIIVSSREISSFVNIDTLNKFKICPFTLEQSLELIDKLEFCPEDPSIKQEFRKKLETDYYQTHREFVENPLLLTLMLMRYRVFSDIPGKRYRFYEQAYLTLLLEHDSNKLAFQRSFRSVKEPDDFTIVFREFCAKSFRKADYEFDERKIDEYLKKLKSIEKSDDRSLMTTENFLFDACNSVCIMTKDGYKYHFIHRSFQEYFFADYYSRQEDAALKKLGNYLKEKNPSYDAWNPALSMLYELSPEKMEKFIILPFLSDIFELPETSQYWRFLKQNYYDLRYVKHRELSEINAELERDDIKKLDYFEPGSLKSGKTVSTLSTFIFKHFSIMESSSLPYHLQTIVDLFSEYPDLPYICVYGGHFGYSMNYFIGNHNGIVNTLTFNATFSDIYKPQCIKDKNNNPVIFGYMYEFDYSLGETDPDKYPDIVAYLTNQSYPCMKTFNKVKNLYLQLSEKYNDCDKYDDDF